MTESWAQHEAETHVDIWAEQEWSENNTIKRECSTWDQMEDGTEINKTTNHNWELFL